MRFVIMESFDATEVKRFFEADIGFRIGGGSDGNIHRTGEIVGSGDDDVRDEDRAAPPKRER